MTRHHAAGLGEDFFVPSDERIPGSARGARVGGSLVALIFGSALYLPTLAADWSVSETWSSLDFALFLVFSIVRPWFMGAWMSDGLLVLRGWFRTTRIPLSQIEGVTTVQYLGLLSYGPIGWIPFVGSIAVIKIREATGRARDFPGTVGRRKTIHRVARRIREGCGITATRDYFDPLE